MNKITPEQLTARIILRAITIIAVFLIGKRLGSHTVITKIVNKCDEVDYYNNLSSDDKDIFTANKTCGKTGVKDFRFDNNDRAVFSCK